MENVSLVNSSDQAAIHGGRLLRSISVTFPITNRSRSSVSRASARSANGNAVASTTRNRPEGSVPAPREEMTPTWLAGEDVALQHPSMEGRCLAVTNCSAPPHLATCLLQRAVSKREEAEWSRPSVIPAGCRRQMGQSSFEPQVHCADSLNYVHAAWRLSSPSTIGARSLRESAKTDALQEFTSASAGASFYVLLLARRLTRFS